MRCNSSGANDDEDEKEEQITAVNRRMLGNSNA